MKEKRKGLPSIEKLQSLFTYDDGKLYWKEKPKRSRVNIDHQAGGISQGYMRVKIDGVSYVTHRVIWKLLNQEEPPKYIDHINQDKSDNRIENLREVTQSQNSLNNKARGCSFHKASGKWQASIKINYKQISLGLFNTEEEAAAHYTDFKTLYTEMKTS
jgi:hypothetical protein